MKWILFLLSLGTGALLSALAFFLECRSCDRDPSLPLAGVVFYSTLLAIGLWRGPGRLVFGGAFLAFGAHLLLMVRILPDRWCWLCVGAAANSLFLAILALLADRSNLKVAAFALPWSAAVFLLVPKPAAIAVPESEGVSVIIVEKDDCPYCRELREEVLPRLEREFGGRIEVRFRSADDFPGVRKTPTILVTRRKESRVIEGLPPYEMLRDAVARALEGSP